MNRLTNQEQVLTSNDYTAMSDEAEILNSSSSDELIYDEEYQEFLIDLGPRG